MSRAEAFYGVEAGEYEKTIVGSLALLGSQFNLEETLTILRRVDGVELPTVEGVAGVAELSTVDNGRAKTISDITDLYREYVDNEIDRTIERFDDDTETSVKNDPRLVEIAKKVNEVPPEHTKQRRVAHELARRQKRQLRLAHFMIGLIDIPFEEGATIHPITAHNEEDIA